jgi:hypothetical protein
VYVLPSIASAMEAGSGARCAKPGGSELLRISARTLDRRCHRTVLHHLGQASLAGVDFRRRHLSMEKESDELLPYMDAPNLVKLSFRNGGQARIAPVHPDFLREQCSLSLMG